MNAKQFDGAATHLIRLAMAEGVAKGRMSSFDVVRILSNHVTSVATIMADSHNQMLAAQADEKAKELTSIIVPLPKNLKKQCEHKNVIGVKCQDCGTEVGGAGV